MMIGPEKLRSYRDRHNLTNAKLADLLDVSKNTMDNILGGRFAPRLDTYARIEELLGRQAVKPSDFVETGKAA